MLVFKRQGIIGPLIRNGRGNLLPPHGSHRPGRSREVPERQEFRHGREFIGLVIHFALSQPQTIGVRPGAHQRHRCFGGGLGQGRAQGCAVYRPAVAPGQVAAGGTPGQATLRQCVWGQARSPPSEGGIPWETRGPGHNLLAPLGWRVAVCCAVFPARSATADRTDGNHEHSAALVARLGTPRSGERSKLGMQS
jgi:hypothetical protein